MSRPEEHRRNWRNEITLRSWEHYDRYEPAAFIDRISPTPLLMIVGIEDAMTPAADALAAYARALEPKQLLLVPGGHYDVYAGGLDHAAVLHIETDFLLRHACMVEGSALTSH